MNSFIIFYTTQVERFTFQIFFVINMRERELSKLINFDKY